MRMSKLYMPTLREMPSEAEIPSHQLLLRAGMVRNLVSGIYSYLPLGYRVIRKIEDVVREEMDNAGGQEALMSAVQPRALWDASGRWEDFGPEMFKLRDRNSRDFCLGPTHEEYFTSLIQGEIRSYKQLPLNLYQIQTKYRDEKRPRFGVIRAREFIMKDAYSFDKDEEGMENSYRDMWKAYDRIFDRLKLRYRVVEGDSGAMGGNQSHEHMAMSEVGEGIIAYCDGCDYAATDEKAEVVYEVEKSDEDIRQPERVHTPGATTIEDLVEFFNAEEARFGKAVVYNVSNEPVVVILPGDRELNETKLCNYLGITEHELEMADDETIMRISGAEAGFTGPVGLSEDVRLLVDSRITDMRNLIVGGNETDYHLKDVNHGVDFHGEVVQDLLLIEEGDICPRCGMTLMMDRGIEVGNIFQLGTKYSESLNANYLDEHGREKPIVMGSYGVGISRTMAAIVEQYHDEYGIIWPLVVAPYHIIITVINNNDDEQRILGERLYDNLRARGLEVLLDDRKERPGVKFNDRDLIGIPIRVTVGRKAAENIVEYSLRREGENIEIEEGEVLARVEDEFKREGVRI
ncbi:MAG: proline--tRNA ligase [Tissierellia bacterium]|nr:proline--tRNA ligase [Tissierellia bacterium]